jgi:ABC-type transporter lipoprotein component MlaA
VVVDEGAPVPTEDAWTFRFLVPTVLGLSGLIVVATVVGYGRRVRGRYRVVR